MSLSASPVTDSTDLFGKTAADLQQNIAIGSNNAITGTLKYVDDYSSAFGPGEDSGNYIAIKFESDEDAIITAEVVNGVHGPVTLDEDGILVARIADKSSQTLKIVASKEGATSVTKIYTLDELTCEVAP